MKFVVDKKTENSGRSGHLLHPESDKKFPTPLLLQTTKGGSIPHLGKETFGYVTSSTDHVLQICLANTDHMEEALKQYQKGTASYVGLEGSPVFLTMKDPCEVCPSGYNEKDFVPLFTRRGKVPITSERYMSLVEAFQPDIYHSLCDSDTNEESSKKRIRKSLERSTAFFKECLDIHSKSPGLSRKLFLAPIVGGYCKFTRSNSIEVVKSSSAVGGYIIDGLHSSGSSAAKCNLDSLQDIVSHCLAQLSDDKLKMMAGAYTPLATLHMIQLGVDVFDSSYAYLATKNSRALTFNFERNGDESTSVAEFSIDLTRTRYRDDFGPLLAGCECLACRKHSRAYVYHLINTKELLAPILLMIHNTHHYIKFFEVIRKTITDDKLPALIELMKQQIPDQMHDGITVEANNFVKHEATSDEVRPV